MEMMGGLGMGAWTSAWIQVVRAHRRKIKKFQWDFISPVANGKKEPKKQTPNNESKIQTALTKYSMTLIFATGSQICNYSSL